MTKILIWRKLKVAVADTATGVDVWRRIAKDTNMDVNLTTDQPAALSLALASSSTNSQLVLREAFARELNPVGGIEKLIVEEISHRAWQRQQYEQALDDFRNQATSVLCTIQASAAQPKLEDLRAALATVVASDKHASLLGQSLAVSRAMIRAVGELQRHRANDGNALGDWLKPDRRFCSEPRCLAYLVRRFQTGAVACRRCRKTKAGSFLAARRAWECAYCHLQTGLRAGTCMERSALPLVTWFAAIRIILLRPTTSTIELAAALNIRRGQTVGLVQKRIRAAIRSEDFSARLAELDQVFLGIT